MRRQITNPKEFGRVALLMGSSACLRSTASHAGERPATDGRAGVCCLIEVAPGMAAAEATHA
jgi:hypothetical protein